MKSMIARPRAPSTPALWRKLTAALGNNHCHPGACQIERYLNISRYWSISIASLVFIQPSPLAYCATQGRARFGFSRLALDRVQHLATLGGGWGITQNGSRSAVSYSSQRGSLLWFGTVIGKHYLLSRVATLMALALWAGGLILSLVALLILFDDSSVPSFPPQVPQQPPHGGNSDQETYQDAEQEVGHVFPLRTDKLTRE